MSADFTIRIEIPAIHVHLHAVAESAVLAAILHLQETLMATKDETIAQLESIRAEMQATAEQNAKANAEISAAITANTANVTTLTQQIADLQAQVAAGGTDIPPDVVGKIAELQVAADAAKASSQALDDLTPDA